MDALINAIQGRREIEFTYDGLHRVVRPAALGTHVSTGEVLLRGYQVSGASQSNSLPAWELYATQKIAALVITERVFGEDPPGYVRGDRHLNAIVAEL